MTKLKSMSGEYFAGLIGLGLVAGLFIGFGVFTVDSVKVGVRRAAFDQVVAQMKYQEMLYGALTGQEKETDESEDLFAAQVIGRYLRREYQKGRSLEDILGQEKMAWYLKKRGLSEPGDKELAVMSSCPYWQEFKKDIQNRKVVKELLSGERKETPSLPTPPTPRSAEVRYLPFWFYLLLVQFCLVAAIGIGTALYMEGMDCCWYQWPGGIAGRVFFFLLFSPGGWPVMILASTSWLFKKVARFFLSWRPVRSAAAGDCQVINQPQGGEPLLEKLQKRLAEQKGGE